MHAAITFYLRHKIPIFKKPIAVNRIYDLCYRSVYDAMEQCQNNIHAGLCQIKLRCKFKSPLIGIHYRVPLIIELPVDSLKLYQPTHAQSIGSIELKILSQLIFCSRQITQFTNLAWLAISKCYGTLATNYNENNETKQKENTLNSIIIVFFTLN